MRALMFYKKELATQQISRGGDLVGALNGEIPSEEENGQPSVRDRGKEGETDSALTDVTPRHEGNIAGRFWGRGGAYIRRKGEKKKGSMRDPKGARKP